MLRSVGSRRAFLVAALALGAGTVAYAQGPVLHEFVPDVRGDEALVLGASGSAEPTAILYDGELIPAPRDGALGPDERAMSAIAGDGAGSEEAGRRSPTFRPDRITDLEGTLGYYSVFSPAIAPFKRVTALDAVALDVAAGGVPVLGVYDEETRRVPVVGVSAVAPDDRPRDRFWGSVVLDFTMGRRVPLPSVSPESRMLTLRTEPETSLSIEKDGADNYFAVATGSLQSSEVRVTYLTDAPRDYFAAETLPDVRADSLSAEARPLPPALAPRAHAFAAELGLRPDMAIGDVLAGLTRHFRSFTESSEPPEDTGDIYLDLSRGMRGICRHRSYSFVITALGLGVPARFVMNEAHAWVEVKMLRVGWMRIDLGGAADGLEAHNAQDRPRYRAASPDPLPRPPIYEASYSQGAGNVSGLRSDGAAGGAGGAADGSGTNANAATSEDPNQSSAGLAAAAERRPGDARVPLSLRVDRDHHEVFRGRAVEVTGRAEGASGVAAEGLRVEVLLQGEERQQLLGVTVTRAGGYFRGNFGIPPETDVGEYQLIVRTPGSHAFLPATAQ